MGGGCGILVAVDPFGELSDEVALSWDLPTREGLLMGWRRGDAGGVDKEEEREERPEDVRGEGAEVEAGGVAGGAGMVSLGLRRSDVGVVVVGDEVEPGLELEEDGEAGFGAAELPVCEGSMAKNSNRQQKSQKGN